MPLRPIEIQLTGTGAGQTKSEVHSVADELKGLGESGKKAGADVKQGLGGIGDEVGKNRAALRQVTQDMRNLGESVPGVASFRSFSQGIMGMKAQIGDVSAMMRELRNAGDGGPFDTGALQKGGQALSGILSTMGAIGDLGNSIRQKADFGIAMSNELARVSEEGRGVEARLESILNQKGRLADLDTINSSVDDVRKRGHFDDDDSLREASVRLLSFNTNAEQTGTLLELAARQARTMKGEMSDVAAVAQQLGTAFNNGKVANLVRAGVTLDPAEIEKINDAYARSAAEGQALFVELVGRAIRNNTVKLEDSLTATQAAANDAKNALDEFQTNAGEGAANANAQISHLNGALLQIANNNPELEKTAGYVFSMGSHLASGVGSLLQFGAQLGQLYLGYVALTGAQGTNAISTGLNATAQGEAALALEAETIAAGEAAIANGAAGASAGTSAIGFGLMATGIWGVVAAAGAAVVALGALLIAKKSWDVNKDAILSPTSSTTDKRTDKQKEDDAQKLESLNDIRERSKGLSPRDRYVIDQKLSVGYRDLGDLDTAGDLSAEAAALRKQLPKNFTTPNSRDAQILLRTIRGLNTGKNTAARLANDGFKGYGHYGSESGSESNAEKLQSQGEKIQADAARALSGETPTPTAPRPSLASRVRSAFSGNASGDDPYADEIEQLERELHYARGKANKGRRQDIQDRLFELKAKQKDWREAHKAEVSREREESRQAKAAQRQAERDQKAAEREQLAEDKAADRKRAMDDADGTMIQSLERQNAANAQIANLQDELDAARDAKNAARVGQLTEQIAKVRADAAYADEMAKAALEDDKAHRSALEVEARLRHDGALDAARHEAERAARDVREMVEGSQAASAKSTGNSSNHDDELRNLARSLQSMQSGGSGLIDLGGGQFGPVSHSAPRFGGRARVGVPIDMNLNTANMDFGSMQNMVNAMNRVPITRGVGYIPDDMMVGMRRQYEFGAPTAHMGADGMIEFISRIKVDARQFGVAGLRGRSKR